jgi:hypothetical protein
MTSESPWSQTPSASDEPASRTASGVAGPIVVLALLVTTTVGAGVAWWLQDSRVAAKEQERAAAAAELAKLATRVQAAEATASSATQELKKAQALAEASSKQAAEVSGQVDALRKESASVRAERDEVRSALAAAKADIERARVNDLDPGSMPQVDLAKVFARNANYRTMVDFQLAGSNAVPGLDKAEVEKMLGASMQTAGMTAVPQSPFRVAVFVSVGREKVRSIGVMMLVLRNMKVPGEAGSREVAVWGQQRTSSAGDAEASGQVRGLLEELCREFAKAAGVQASTAAPSAPPSATPAAPAQAPVPATAPAPAAAPANAPKA